MSLTAMDYDRKAKVGRQFKLLDKNFFLLIFHSLDIALRVDMVIIQTDFPYSYHLFEFRQFLKKFIVEFLTRHHIAPLFNFLSMDRVQANSRINALLVFIR